MRSHRATAGPARGGVGLPSALPALVTVLVLLLGATACSTDDPVEPETPASPTATPNPNPSPSVWTTHGSPAGSRAATVALLRAGDLPEGYRASPLTEIPTGTVRPPACRAMIGPATGLLDGSTGQASTAFVGNDLSTAIAHSVGLYATPAAAVAAVERARRLGRTCARTVVNGTTFTVTATDHARAGGAPGVTLEVRQARGVGETTVTVDGRLVSVLAIASRPPGPQIALVRRADLAVARRLSEAVIEAGA